MKADRELQLRLSRLITNSIFKKDINGLRSKSVSKKKTVGTALFTDDVDLAGYYATVPEPAIPEPAIPEPAIPYSKITEQTPSNGQPSGASLNKTYYFVDFLIENRFKNDTDSIVSTLIRRLENSGYKVVDCLKNKKTSPDQIRREEVSTADIRAVAEREPDLMNRAYPRRFLHGDQWTSPRHLAAWIESNAELANHGFVRNGHLDIFAPASLAAALEIVENKVPTFFVTADLARALLNTRPPQDMKVSDLKLPAEGVLFVLPRIPELQGTRFLGMGNVKGGKPYPCPLQSSQTPTPIQFDKGGLVTFTIDQLHTTSTMILSQEPQDLIASSFGDTSSLYDNCDGWMSDRSWIWTHILTINLLLALASRPQLNQPEEIVRRGAMNARSGPKPDLWKPNLLGYNYRLPAMWQGGTHSSPEAHFRAGHWRYYNPLENPNSPWKQCQAVWIEPTMVNPKPTAAS